MVDLVEVEVMGWVQGYLRVCINEDQPVGPHEVDGIGQYALCSMASLEASRDGWKAWVACSGALHRQHINGRGISASILGQ